MLTLVLVVGVVSCSPLPSDFPPGAPDASAHHVEVTHEVRHVTFQVSHEVSEATASSSLPSAVPPEDDPPIPTATTPPTLPKDNPAVPSATTPPTLPEDTFGHLAEKTHFGDEVAKGDVGINHPSTTARADTAVENIVEDAGAVEEQEDSNTSSRHGVAEGTTQPPSPPHITEVLIEPTETPVMLQEKVLTSEDIMEHVMPVHHHSESNDETTSPEFTSTVEVSSKENSAKEVTSEELTIIDNTQNKDNSQKSFSNDATAAVSTLSDIPAEQMFVETPKVIPEEIVEVEHKKDNKVSDKLMEGIKAESLTAEEEPNKKLRGEEVKVEDYKNTSAAESKIEGRNLPAAEGNEEVMAESLVEVPLTLNVMDPRIKKDHVLEASLETSEGVEMEREKQEVVISESQLSPNTKEEAPLLSSIADLSSEETHLVEKKEVSLKLESSIMEEPIDPMDTPRESRVFIDPDYEYESHETHPEHPAPPKPLVEEEFNFAHKGLESLSMTSPTPEIPVEEHLPAVEEDLSQASKEEQVPPANNEEIEVVSPEKAEDTTLASTEVEKPVSNEGEEVVSNEGKEETNAEEEEPVITEGKEEESTEGEESTEVEEEEDVVSVDDFIPESSSEAPVFNNDYDTYMDPLDVGDLPDMLSPEHPMPEHDPTSASHPQDHPDDVAGGDTSDLAAGDHMLEVEAGTPRVLPPQQEPVSAAAPQALTVGCIIAIVFGVVVSLVILIGIGGFVAYQRKTLNRPKALNSDRGYAGSDSGGYIDDQCRVSYVNSQMDTPKGSPEDLISLDNDSFLNSLESMTIQNLWTDSIRHTKL